jgi:hypothetical protein
VRVGIPAHLTPAGRPSRVRQAESGHSRLTEHLFDDAVDAVDVAVSLISVFHQHSLP